MYLLSTCCANHDDVFRGNNFGIPRDGVRDLSEHIRDCHPFRAVPHLKQLDRQPLGDVPAKSVDRTGDREFAVIGWAESTGSNQSSRPQDQAF